MRAIHIRPLLLGLSALICCASLRAEDPVVTRVMNGQPDPSTEPSTPEASRMRAGVQLRDPAEEPRTPRFWGTAAYEHTWQYDSKSMPVLINGANQFADTALGTGSFLGAPGTSPALGGRHINFDDGNSGKIMVGGWIDRDERFGFEVGGFYTPSQSISQGVASNGTSTLAVTFNDFNPAVHGPNSIPISGDFDAGATLAGGHATFTAKTEQYGAEANFLAHVATSHPTEGAVLDETGFLGFRYFGVHDDFSDSIQGSNTLTDNFSFGAQDSFRTDNDFYAVNLGVHLRGSYKGFYAEVTPRIALGVDDETVNVSGSSSSTAPADPALGGNAQTTGNPGGFFATGNKLGQRNQQEFAYMPQITLKLGYSFTRNIEGFVGYDAMYLSSLARATDQVNTNIDSGTLGLGNYFPTQGGGGVAGATDHSPAPGIVTSSLFQQGVSAGLTFRL